eukprot:scaffold29652_cov15-Tisochrysis_lutea.AAC.1
MGCLTAAFTLVSIMSKCPVSSKGPRTASQQCFCKGARVLPGYDPPVINKPPRPRPKSTCLGGYVILVKEHGKRVLFTHTYTYNAGMAPGWHDCPERIGLPRPHRSHAGLVPGVLAALEPDPDLACGAGPGGCPGC